MAKRQPLTAAEVDRGLKAAGFEEQPRTGTSHVKWLKYANGTKYVVTVDHHHAPYSQQLISSIAKQANMSVKQFYELCSKDGAKQARRGTLEWLTALFSDNR